MPLAFKINVALREQNCQKIGSKRVKYIELIYYILKFIKCIYCIRMYLYIFDEHLFSRYVKFSVR